MKQIEVLCKQSEQVRAVVAIIHDDEGRIRLAASG